MRAALPALMVLALSVSGCSDIFGMCGPTAMGVDLEVNAAGHWDNATTSLARAALAENGYNLSWSSPGASSIFAFRWGTERDNGDDIRIAWLNGTSLKVEYSFLSPSQEFDEKDGYAKARAASLAHAAEARVSLNQTWAMLAPTGWTLAEQVAALSSVAVC